MNRRLSVFVLALCAVLPSRPLDTYSAAQRTAPALKLLHTHTETFSQLSVFLAWSQRRTIYLVPSGTSLSFRPAWYAWRSTQWNCTSAATIWPHCLRITDRCPCDPPLKSMSEGNSGISAVLMAIMGVVSVYVGLLESAPILTRAVTAAIIGLFGDLCAQYFEQSQKKGTRYPSRFTVDRNRSLAVIMDGLILSGPCLHFLYTGLEDLVPTSKGGFFPATVHVIADEFIFDPIFVVLFFLMTGVLERRDLFTDILPQIRREYWPAVRSTWGLSFIFVPLQFLSFRFLPLQYRVLTVNIMDVLWTAVVSFFSHKEEDVCDYAPKPNNRPEATAT